MVFPWRVKLGGAFAIAGGGLGAMVLALSARACSAPPAPVAGGPQSAPGEHAPPAAPPRASASVATPAGVLPAPALPDLIPEPPPTLRRAEAWPPATTFGVYGELRGAPEFASIYAAGDLVLVAGAVTGVGRFVLPVAPPNGAPVAILPDVGAIVGVPQGYAFAALGLVVGVEDGALVAFDVRGGRRRWVTAMAPPSGPVDAGVERSGAPLRLILSNVLTADDRLIAAVDWVDPGAAAARNAELVVLDASRGTILWRRPRGGIASADGRVYVEGTQSWPSVLTLDVATGRTLWSSDGAEEERPMPPGLEAADGQLVAFRSRWGTPYILVAWDAASGRVVGQHPLPTLRAGSEIEAMRLSRGTAYTIVEDRGPLGVRMRVVAFDVATARVRWESAVVEAGPIPGPGTQWLGLDDDVVLACLPDGILRALDRGRGTVLWHHGIGRCDGIAVTRPDPEGPALIVAKSFSTNAPDAGPLGKERLLVFGRGVGPAPLEHATLEGKATPGVCVRVGTALVKAGPSGRYRATVDARGVVTVLGFFLQGWSPMSTPYIELDGRRGPYEADLDYVNDGP